MTNQTDAQAKELEFQIRSITCEGCKQNYLLDGTKHRKPGSYKNQWKHIPCTSKHAELIPIVIHVRHLAAAEMAERCANRMSGISQTCVITGDDVNADRFHRLSDELEQWATEERKAAE